MPSSGKDDTERGAVKKRALAEGNGGPAAGPRFLLPSDANELLDQLPGSAYGAAVWEALRSGRASRRREVVRSLGEHPDRRARQLLAAALWDDEPEIALLAVAGVSALNDRRSVVSLERLAEIARSERVVAAAQTAAAALRDSGTGDEAPARPADAGEYWASFIDGDGCQLLMVARPAGDGSDPDRLRFAIAAVSDQRGIVDASGADSASWIDVEALRNAGSRRSGRSAPTRRTRGRALGPGEDSSDGEEPLEIGWVRVDAAYCQAALEEAHQMHRRDHRRLPGTWEFWRDDFEAGVGGPAPAAAALSEGQLRRRLPQTASLLHFEGFGSWLILGEDLAPFLPAARTALAGPSPQREARLARVISSCLASNMKKRQRRLWQRRLQRQAALWARRGDPIVRELCLAAAWGLGDGSGVPPEEHPLLRAMTRASLDLIL